VRRICIFGAGAIGGYIAARLAHQGEAHVSLVARGPQLAAITANGLTLHHGDERITVHPRAAAQASELGEQDFVIVTLKANSLPLALDQIMPLIGKQTAVLFAQNGLPWWYFYKSGGPLEGSVIEAVDPGGGIWQRLGPERALGCVVWQSAEVVSPGVVRHSYGDRMPIAEPSGEKTARAQTLSGLLVRAGIKSPLRANLRDEIWLKLWGNLSFNPLSVLTRGTLLALASDAGTQRVLADMMREAREVGEKLGVHFTVSIEDRIAMAAKVGHHRTSMLQDVEAGRPNELDCLLGAVIELARRVEVATPTLNLVYDLTKFYSRA
jgi:2-dehydropantoate 2-reductase